MIQSYKQTNRVSEMPNLKVTLNGEFPLRIASGHSIEEDYKVDLKHDFSDVLSENIKEYMHDSGMGMQNRIDKAVEQLFNASRIGQSEEIKAYTPELDTFSPTLSHGTVPGESSYLQKTSISIEFPANEPLEKIGLGNSEWAKAISEAATEIGFEQDMFDIDFSSDFTKLANNCDLKRDESVEQLYTVVPLSVPALLSSSDIGKLKELPSKGSLFVVGMDSFTLPLYPASISSLLPDHLQSIKVKEAREHLGTSIFSIQSERKEKAPSFPDFSDVKHKYNPLEFNKQIFSVLREYDGHPQISKAFEQAVQSAGLSKQEKLSALVSLASFSLVNNHSPSLLHNITSLADERSPIGQNFDDKFLLIESLDDNIAGTLKALTDLNPVEIVEMGKRLVDIDKNNVKPDDEHTKLKL